MLEVDPINQAQSSLASVCLDVLRGGDPNRIKGPLCALLRAKGSGKQAREIEGLKPLAWKKPTLK